MSPQPGLERSNGELPEPDLVDVIAEDLPVEIRPAYYRAMAHMKVLPECDEMLKILRAMQFLTILIKEAPKEVALEREKLGDMLARSLDAMERTHQANLAYQKQLEQRLTELPQEIAKGISAEAIATKIVESLRQQFHETGLPVTAKAIGVQATSMRDASKELAAALDEFTHPRSGAVPRLNEALSSMRADLRNATDHVRTMMGGLGKELWRSVAILCAAAVVIGFFLGVLYRSSRDQPVQPLPATSAVQSGAQPSAPQPTYKKRAQPGSPVP
jgi:hypothetical protein